MELFSWILAVVGIVGIHIAGKKNRWGWALGALYQILWIVYAYFTHQYPFIIVCVAYLVIYIKNFFEWSAHDIKQTLQFIVGSLSAIDDLTVNYVEYDFEQDRYIVWVQKPDGDGTIHIPVRISQKELETVTGPDLVEEIVSLLQYKNESSGSI